jgi:hypothetical protein
MFILALLLPIFVVILFALTSRWVLAAKRDRAAFEQRFPPISDAEFVARCGPGTNPNIALRVRRIMADQLGVEYDRIYPSSRLVEDLGAE